MHFIRAHLFKLYYHALPLHVDLREKLAEAKELEDYEKVVTELNERLRKAAKVRCCVLVCLCLFSVG